MKKNLWLGHIVPKFKSEIAQLYWTTDIPNTEIAEAYGVVASEITKLAGDGIVKGKVFTCRECSFLVTVSSRAEATDKFRNFQSRFPWTGARWAAPDMCKRCRHRLRDADQGQFMEEMRGRGQRRRELATMPYREYLATPEWDRTRKDALQRAKYSCQTCSGKGELHVHHRTYIRRGHEQASDLIVLCADCHALFHQNARLAEGGRAA